MSLLRQIFASPEIDHLTPQEERVCLVCTQVLGPKGLEALSLLKNSADNLSGEFSGSGDDEATNKVDTAFFKQRWEETVGRTNDIKDVTRPDAPYIAAVKMVRTCQLLGLVCKSVSDKIKELFSEKAENLDSVAPVACVFVTSLKRCEDCETNNNDPVLICGVRIFMESCSGAQMGGEKTLMCRLWWMKSGAGGVLNTKQIRRGPECLCGRRGQCMRFQSACVDTEVCGMMISTGGLVKLGFGASISDLDDDEVFTMDMKASRWQREGPLEVYVEKESSDGTISEQNVNDICDFTRQAGKSYIGNDESFSIIKRTMDYNWKDGKLKSDIRGHSAHLRHDESDSEFEQLRAYSSKLGKKIRAAIAWSMCHQMFLDRENFEKHMHAGELGQLEVQYAEDDKTKRRKGYSRSGYYETRGYFDNLVTQIAPMMAAIAAGRRVTDGSPSSVDHHNAMLTRKELIVCAREDSVQAREDSVHIREVAEEARTHSAEKMYRGIEDLAVHYTRMAADAKVGRAMMTSAISDLNKEVNKKRKIN
jgi:hypothetical protein